MKTKDQMNNVVYRLRDLLGDNDPMQCEVTGKDWNNDKHLQCVETLLTIRRLAKKHHRLAEMDCNGEGFVRGQRYYGGAIDDYARREYGYNVKSAYLTEKDSEEGVSVFMHESDKIENKIKALIEKLPYKSTKNGLYPWKVEFQGDPRGNTVKIYFKEHYIDINF